MKFQQSITVLIIGIFINIQANDTMTTNQLKSIFTEIEEEKAILSNLYKKASNRPEIGTQSIHEKVSYLQVMSRSNRISKEKIVGISYQLLIVLELEKDYIVLFKATRPKSEQKDLVNYIKKIDQNKEFLLTSILNLFSDTIKKKRMTISLVQ